MSVVYTIRCVSFDHIIPVPISRHLGRHILTFRQFQLYAGLLANIPIWHKIDKNKPEDEDDDDVEDEDEPTKVNIKVPEPQRRPRPPRARIPYSTYGKDPIEVNDDGEIRDLLDDEAAVKEDKLADFLNDPERSVQVFLSSYMRKQGLIWSALLFLSYYLC